MKVYLLGSATNASDAMVEQYVIAEQQLAAVGYNVVNIMRYTGWHVEALQAQAACRINYMTKCDAVFVLPDYLTDAIAQLEFATAMVTGMQVIFANGVPKPRKIEFITH